MLLYNCMQIADCCNHGVSAPSLIRSKAKSLISIKRRRIQEYVRSSSIRSFRIHHLPTPLFIGHAYTCRWCLHVILRTTKAETVHEIIVMVGSQNFIKVFYSSGPSCMVSH